MTAPIQINLAAVHAAAARATAASQARARGLTAARELIGLHGIKSPQELLAVIESVACAVDKLDTLCAEFATRLLEMACDLQDELHPEASIPQPRVRVYGELDAFTRETTRRSAL